MAVLKMELPKPKPKTNVNLHLQKVSEVYKVAKHLLGKMPKKITNDKDSTLTIENNNGEVNVFDFRGANIYLNNPTIKEAISQEFETLEADKSVTDLTFLDNKEQPLLTVEREEFYSLSSSGSTPELLPNEQIITVDAVLNISSLDLEFKKKWDFYYLGNKIFAKVEDKVFIERINKGEKFSKGDKFEVKMEIKQQFDESVDAFINKSYKVVEVIKHIDRPVQGDLGLS